MLINYAVAMNALKSTHFRTLDSVSVDTWKNFAVDSIPDMKNKLDCFIRCWFDFNSTCFGFAYESKLKICYLIDITADSSSLTVSTVYDTHDLEVLKGLARSKGCPEGNH